MLFRRLIPFINAILLLHTAGIAGGFQRNEQGARAMGMGGAFVAQASDLSALFFNPAGLALQTRGRIMVGTTLIIPSTSFQGPAPSAYLNTDMESRLFFPVHAYASYIVNDDLVLGLAAFSPFEFGTEWPEYWTGRYTVVKTELRSYAAGPSVAYKLNNQLFVGAGVSVVYSAFTYQHDINHAAFGDGDGQFSYDATGSGFNFNVGVLFQPLEGLSLGVSYRALTEIEFSGTAEFTTDSLNGYYPGGNSTVTLPFPSSLQGGASYKVLDDLTLEGDLQYVGWSEYKAFTLDIPQGPAGPSGPPLQGPVTSIKRWRNAWIGRIGLEYAMNENLNLRAGFVRKDSPQPRSTTDPMYPDADRSEITIGIGYEFSEILSVDAAFQLTLNDSKEAIGPFPGIYTGSSRALAVNVSYAY